VGYERARDHHVGAPPMGQVVARAEVLVGRLVHRGRLGMSGSGQRAQYRRVPLIPNYFLGSYLDRVRPHHVLHQPGHGQAHVGYGPDTHLANDKSLHLCSDAISRGIYLVQDQLRFDDFTVNDRQNAHVCMVFAYFD